MLAPRAPISLGERPLGHVHRLSWVHAVRPGRAASAREQSMNSRLFIMLLSIDEDSLHGLEISVAM